MARCTYCNTETFIYEGGDIPICIECADARRAPRKPPASEPEIGASLQREFLAATKRAREAAESFDAIMTAIPSGIPHPDGVQRIQNASRAVSAARAEMMKAHNRLNEYLNRGIVPQDRQRSG